MARQYDVDDPKWFEVKVINGYALFMGYLMMGVRGLGLLIITWTTVVLLGGFVSDLGKKDFWCLTGITLIQTAGVFNFLLTEKINDMVHLSWGLLAAAVGTFIRFDKVYEDKRVPWKRLFLALAASAIQGLVLFVILCPVSILYVFGIYISAGTSLWRLIKHDFGNDGDGGANMKPALQVLYSLAVAQGVLFGYKTIHAFAAKNGLVKFVYNMFDKEVHEALLEDYLEVTVAGCETDPSFATGRNLVTYGVDLMKESRSNEGFIAGVKVLGSAINEGTGGRKVLAKSLLSRPDYCSSAIIQRLLETVGPKGPYNREIKTHVVRILDVIACCIPLEQLPRAIECLCSVVDMKWTPRDGKLKDFDSEKVQLLEEYEKDYIERDSPDDWCFFCNSKLSMLCQCMCGCKRKTVEDDIKKNRRGFDQLLVISANIIYKLATDKDSGWNMRTCVSNSMLHKIAMFPAELHRENHYPCREGKWQNSELRMLEQCWVLTEWLLVALTETSSLPLLPAATPVGEGRQSRSKSKEIEEEVERTIQDSIQSTIKCIFDCLDCGVALKWRAIQIVLHLCWDTSFIVKDSESSKRRLEWVLLLILCSTSDSEYWMAPSLVSPNNNHWDVDDGIRILAVEELSKMLQEKHGELPSEGSTTDLQLIHLALGDLKSAFDADSEDISMRTHAVIIMEGLLNLCPSYSSNLTRYSHLEEFLEEFMVNAIPKVVKETLILCGSKTRERQQETTDEEKGEVSQDNDVRIDTKRLRKALTSLCFKGYMHSNATVKSSFKEIASKTCEEQGKSFEDFKCILEKSLRE